MILLLQSGDFHLAELLLVVRGFGVQRVDAVKHFVVAPRKAGELLEPAVADAGRGGSAVRLLDGLLHRLEGAGDQRGEQRASTKPSNSESASTIKLLLCSVCCVLCI